jgi:hypothetical protein
MGVAGIDASPPRRRVRVAAALSIGLVIVMLCARAGAPAAGDVTARAATRLFVHPVMVGIGEQHPFVFADPRFWRLKISHVRLNVGWDALDNRLERGQIDAWMQAARSRNSVPLVTFDQSHRRGRHRILPSVHDFLREFRLFRKRYPWVREFGTWNEANVCAEPTCLHVERVVAYWRAIVHACSGCKVLAAEVLDVPSAAGWVRQFVRVAHEQPRYWGLHNYLGANRLDPASTLAVLHAMRGEVWFTETAGLVHRRGITQHKFPENASHAAIVTRYLLTQLSFVSPRIARVYLYEWNAASRHDSWDSALIGYNGRPRPAYYVLYDALRARHTGLRVG